MTNYAFTLGVPLNLDHAFEIHSSALNLMDYLIKEHKLSKVIFFNSSVALSANYFTSEHFDSFKEHLVLWFKDRPKLKQSLISTDFNQLNDSSLEQQQVLKMLSILLFKVGDHTDLSLETILYKSEQMNKLVHRYELLATQGCDLLVCGQAFKHYVQPQGQLNSTFKLTGFMEILATFKQKDLKVINC